MLGGIGGRRRRGQQKMRCLDDPGDLPNPGIGPGSPALQEDSLPTELSGKPIVLKSELL